MEQWWNVTDRGNEVCKDIEKTCILIGELITLQALVICSIRNTHTLSLQVYDAQYFPYDKLLNATDGNYFNFLRSSGYSV